MIIQFDSILITGRCSTSWGGGGEGVCGERITELRYLSARRRQLRTGVAVAR